ncbi:MAG: hypothetical protein Q7T74_06575, partial [Candidatus Saccharibacteria bacterium]|nr:hypothetical protein [Candidatus Saccharibacteria bacterium]
GNGTLAAPWATIEKAIDTQTVDAGETCTVIVKDGDTLAADKLRFDDSGSKHNDKNFVICSQNGGAWTFTYDGGYGTDYGAIEVDGCTSGSLSVDEMILAFSTASRKAVTFAADKGMNLTLTNCSITQTGSANKLLQIASDSGSSARNITLANCTLSSTNITVSIVKAGVITISDSTITSSAFSANFLISGAVAMLDIYNTNITSTAGNASIALSIANTASITRCKMRNCSFSSGDIAVKIIDEISDLLISGCTITGGSVDNDSVALYLGEETAAAVNTGFGRCEIINNTITSGKGSAVRLYFGCNNVDFGFNTTNTGGTPHSFVMYGTNNSIHHNLLRGNLALFEATSGKNHIFNNTIYSFGSAFVTGLPGGGEGSYSSWLYPTGSDIYNNIFVSTTATTYAFDDYEAGKDGRGIHRGTNGDDYMTHYMDYNCYY